MGKIFNNAFLTVRRRELRTNMPEPEHRLWSLLRGRQLKGYKFRRQESIGCYIVDFYCPELKIAIEVDGDTHYQKEAIESDKKRRQKIESFGVRVLRFTNKEIIESPEGVVAEILKILPDKDEKR